jgi:hypothetical protein
VTETEIVVAVTRIGMVADVRMTAPGSAITRAKTTTTLAASGDTEFNAPDSIQHKGLLVGFFGSPICYSAPFFVKGKVNASVKFVAACAQSLHRPFSSTRTNRATR